jgi:hypothetical protein
VDIVSIQTDGENGLHVDVTLASSTTADERAQFLAFARKRTDTPVGESEWREPQRYTFFIPKGDDMQHRLHHLREWLESIPYVRLIVIEYYETRYEPRAK